MTSINVNKMNNKKDFFSNGQINITGDTCPITFVKTKLRLEKMNSGEILEVTLNEGEPLKNVPLSCIELGHEVLDTVAGDIDGTYKLWIRKSE